MIDIELTSSDPEQARLMNEMCIVVDKDDAPIGRATKRFCHLMENINRGLLHRAFSVFLFNDRNRLLLQQRASEKITFPDMWTNTCCSHPLSIFSETGDTLSSSIEGVKRAARRKLAQELGIANEQVLLDEFVFQTRVHYLAPYDATWGEHEIDYILFIKPSNPVSLAVNANEVKDTRWVSPEQLRDMLDDPALSFTPWFKIICEGMLFDWWKGLESGVLKSEDDTIRRIK